MRSFASQLQGLTGYAQVTQTDNSGGGVGCADVPRTGRSSQCGSCGQLFNCVRQKHQCGRCSAISCGPCFYGLGLMSEVLGPCRSTSTCCPACTRMLERERRFERQMLPVLQSGIAVESASDGNKPGWFKLNSEDHSLEWASLERRLNMPTHSWKYSVLDFTEAEGSGRLLTLKFRSTASSGIGAWLSGRTGGEAVEEERVLHFAGAADQSEWSELLADVLTVWIPRLAEQKEQEDRNTNRLASSKTRIEVQEKKRQQRLRQLRSQMNGMSHTAQIVMTRVSNP
eukprot:gb/GEZN01014733.1/.p1 GENE.gb/GEZN01014733.1/~~gb/GEZN01014733.1/.p1  ORF type:complete len:295 (-),score=29.92 gb/GEZN01014733.1/:50-901(-)